MLVKYYERFDMVGEFDPQSGQLHVLPRPEDLEPGETHGWFEILGGFCIVFYRLSSKLWLRVGDKTFDLDVGTSVDWRQMGDDSVFTIASGEEQVVVMYRSGPGFGPPLAEDRTPFVAEEDWDLGLFIFNVLNDEERSNLVRQGAAPPMIT